MEIRVQEGSLGLDSPSNDAYAMIVVTRGIMSRTGRCMGNVDEGFCAQVTAYLPRREGAFDRDVVSIERLYARDRYEPAERNKGGGMGAYVEQHPSDEAVAAAVERARVHLESGAAPVDGIQLRCVEAAPPGSEYSYRVKMAGRIEGEPTSRDEAVERAKTLLTGQATGTEAAVERKPRHGHRWDPWRRYAVHPDKGIIRSDR